MACDCVGTKEDAKFWTKKANRTSLWTSL